MLKRADSFQNRRADNEPPWAVDDLVVASAAALPDLYGRSNRQVQVRNLVRDLEDASCWARFLIRYRDGMFPELFDAVLADAGVRAVLTGVRMPRLNAVMERYN
ncbi:hypothetical protein [Actinomadura coerulea]|uniref:hypothetical protein n=1 Tax=Actinomadura coerulea TaxID=46159 RepID=UPI00342CBA05